MSARGGGLRHASVRCADADTDAAAAPRGHGVEALERLPPPGASSRAGERERLRTDSTTA
jgi:hypothetical protein